MRKLSAKMIVTGILIAKVPIPFGRLSPVTRYAVLKSYVHTSVCIPGSPPNPQLLTKKYKSKMNSVPKLTDQTPVYCTAKTLWLNMKV